MKTFNDLKTENYLKNKIFISKSNSQIEDHDKNFVLKILSSESNLNSDEIFNSLKLIGSTYEYDSYSFNSSGKTFVLKTINDDLEKLLLKEKNNLSKLKKTKISPEVVSFGEVDGVSYLLTSFENGISFDKFSISDLYFNIRSIANYLSYLHEYTEEEKDFCLKSFCEDYLSKIDPQYVFEENLYEELKSSKKFKNFLSLYPKIKESVLSESESIDCKISSLCHLNLDNSKILYRDGQIKFINFQNSNECDPLLDLALTCLYLKISDNKDVLNVFVNQYFSSHRKINLDKDSFKKKLDQMFKIAYKLILCRIMLEFFVESVIHQDSRPKKYINIMRNYEQFRHMLQEDLPNIVNSVDSIIYCYSD